MHICIHIIYICEKAEASNGYVLRANLEGLPPSKLRNGMQRGAWSEFGAGSNCTRPDQPRSVSSDSCLGNLYMGVKQMGAIEICMFASRLPSIMFNLESVKLYLYIAPICFAPIWLPLNALASFWRHPPSANAICQKRAATFRVHDIREPELMPIIRSAHV